MVELHVCTEGPPHPAYVNFASRFAVDLPVDLLNPDVRANGHMTGAVL